MKTREQIIAETRQRHADLVQYFDDVAHWNNTHPGEFIEADPNGDMRRLLDALHQLLEKDTGTGRIDNSELKRVLNG